MTLWFSIMGTEILSLFLNLKERRIEHVRKFERTLSKRLASEIFEDYMFGDIDPMEQYLAYSKKEDEALSFGGCDDDYDYDYDHCYRSHDGSYYNSSLDNLSPIEASLIDKAVFNDTTWGSYISALGVLRGLRYVKSYYEAERIQRLYEKAISRTSDYRGNVYGHVLSRNGIVYEPIKGSYLVGYETDGYFVVSHFAPKTVVAGVKMMKGLVQSDMPIVIATLPYQANQLVKMGFEAIAKVPQYWHGEIHIKTVCVNKAVDKNRLNSLLVSISE